MRGPCLGSPLPGLEGKRAQRLLRAQWREVAGAEPAGLRGQLCCQEPPGCRSQLRLQLTVPQTLVGPQFPHLRQGAGPHERFLTWKSHFHTATRAGGQREGTCLPSHQGWKVRAGPRGRSWTPQATWPPAFSEK